VDGLQVTRRAGKDGRISVDNHAYYLGVAYQGKRVGVRVDAAAAELVITHAGREVKRVALKGLQRTAPRPFGVWLDHLRQEAVAEQRRQRLRRGSRTGTRATASWMATLHDAANRVQDAEARPAADTE
jgi:hypothetical protein